MSVGLARVVALALLSACTPHAQTEPAAQDAKDPTPSVPAEPPAAAVPPAIVPLPVPDFVTAPGHLEGGHYYVTLRPRQLQEFVRALPIAAERDNAVAILSAEWGLPLHSIDDLGLDPDAVITATLLRPIAPRLAAVRDQIQQLAVAAQADDPAAIPPLPPELRRDAATMTFHNRLHIPVRDPEILLSIARKQQRAGGLCERLPHDACLASERATLLLRRDGGALVVDAFIRLSDPDGAAEEGRVEAAVAAMAAGPAKLAALATLAGDFGLYIHGATIPALADIYELGTLVDTLAVTPSGKRRAAIDDSLAGQAALLRLRDTRRLFSGLSVTAELDPSDVRITMSWEPADLTAALLLEKLFAPADEGLPGPTRAALCDEALVCWQMPRLPALAGFGELALGDYASQDKLAPTIPAAGQFGLAVIAVETWPNQLGALQRWSSGGGREAGIARTIFDRLGAIQGAGGTVRLGEVDDASPAHAMYLRFNRQELGLARSLAGMAGVRFVDTPVDGLEHKIAVAPSWHDLTVYIASEPDEQTGWLIGADHLDRVRWLLGSPRELTSAPTFFLGSDDTGRLLAAFGPAGAPDRDAWAAGRKLTVVGELNRTRPRIQISLTRAAPAR